MTIGVSQYDRKRQIEVHIVATYVRRVSYRVASYVAT